MSKHPIIANRTAFLVIGCLEAAWAPLVPYVKRAFSLDEASLGLLMLCTGLGSIIALPLSSWLCVRFGAKRVVYRNNPYVVGRNIYDIGIGCDDGRMP